MSKPTLRLAGLSAKPGERVFGEVPIKLGEAEVRLPIFVINGAGEGPTLAVTAGVHGCEFAGVAGALETGQAVDPAKLSGNLVIVAVSNPPAFWGKVPFIVPLDGKNLNRQFPGRTDGSASQILAHWLFHEVITKANYYIDLHGGDLVEALYPFAIYTPCGKEEVDKASCDLARSFGIRYVLRGETPGSGYSTAPAIGIPAFIAEAGEMGMSTPEMVRMHREGLARVLRHLGMVEGPPLEPVETEVLNDGVDLRAGHDGLFYPEVKLGQWTKKGDRLGVIRDFQGRELEVITAVDDGVILLIYAPLPVKGGDCLFDTGVRM